MTIGYWREEAHAALRAARAALDTPHTPTAEVYAAVAARAVVYSRLAHLTELLVGGPPGTRFRYGATLVTPEYRQDVTQFHAGLRAAAEHPEYPSTPTHPGEQVAQSLRRAADALGAMADIVATHVVPDQRPRTPEGAAIRFGGGVQAALAGVARLSIDAKSVDEQLPAWLARGAEPWPIVYRPVVAAVETVAASRFDESVLHLLAAADGRPTLLDELDVARQPLDPAPSVETAEQAAASVTATHTGLWQQRSQVAVTHLQLATQLGLTVHTDTEDTGSSMLRQWRRAAIAAAALRGTPTVEVGTAAAGELTEVLRWARSQLSTDQRAAPAEDLAQLARVRGQLPALARALHSGLSSAVERGDVFVRESVLQRPAGSLIYRATERWRPAVATDETVQELSRSLWKLQAPRSTAAATTAEVDAAAKLAQGYPAADAAAPAPTVPGRTPQADHPGQPRAHVNPPPQHRSQPEPPTSR